MPTFRKRAFNGHTLVTIYNAHMSHTRALVHISSLSPVGATAADTPPPPDIRAFSASAPSVNISRDYRITAPCALTAQPHPARSPHNRTLRAHRTTAPCALTAKPHPARSPQNRTLRAHRKLGDGPPPAASDQFRLRVPSAAALP